MVYLRFLILPLLLLTPSALGDDPNAIAINRFHPEVEGFKFSFSNFIPTKQEDKMLGAGVFQLQIDQERFKCINNQYREVASALRQPANPERLRDLRINQIEILLISTADEQTSQTYLSLISKKDTAQKGLSAIIKDRSLIKSTLRYSLDDKHKLIIPVLLDPTKGCQTQHATQISQEWNRWGTENQKLLKQKILQKKQPSVPIASDNIYDGLGKLLLKTFDAITPARLEIHEMNGIIASTKQSKTNETRTSTVATTELPQTGAAHGR